MRRSLRLQHSVLILWGLVWVPFSLHRSNSLHDWGQFAFAGRAMLGIAPHYHDGALHVYANLPGIQTGPPGIALAGVLDGVFGRHSDIAAALLAAALAIIAVACCELLLPRRWTWVAGVVVVPIWVYGAGSDGHVDDALTLTLIAATAVMVRRDSPVWSGALLGVAVACKPWAVVVTPVLLGLPPGRRLRSLVALGCGAVAPWLPFLIADPQTLGAVGGYRQPVQSATLLHLLGLHGLSPAWVRPVQLDVAVVVAAVIAYRGWWLAAPLAGICARLILDPALWPYYWMGPAFAAVLAISAISERFPFGSLGRSTPPAPVIGGSLDPGCDAPSTGSQQRR